MWSQNPVLKWRHSRPVGTKASCVESLVWVWAELQQAWYDFASSSLGGVDLDSKANVWSLGKEDINKGFQGAGQGAEEGGDRCQEARVTARRVVALHFGKKFQLTVSFKFFFSLCKFQM
jgi:hypothetical protein